MRTYSIILPCLMLLSASLAAESQSIRSNDLAKLSQKTKAISAVSEYSGSALLASVSAKAGQSYLMSAPMNVQRAVYLKAPGELLQSKQAFLKIFGPEVHHYYSQYQMTKTLLEQSQALFDNSKKLFENKALTESQWLDISQQYYRTKLEYDEFTHFFEYAGNFNEQDESLSILAPMSGILMYEALPTIDTGNLLARIIPENAIRLKIDAAKNNALLPKSVRANSCELAIESVDKYVKQFSQTLWTAPVDSGCNLRWGEQTSVYPQYELQGYLVDKLALFDWQGSSHIFVKRGGNYVAVPVEIQSSQNEQYIVTANESLQDVDVLVSSVSAAQGLLLGLGE